MKFVSSYSGGKDSMLAMYRAKMAGHEPVAILTMFDTKQNRNFFHGLSEPLLSRVSEALGLPVIIGRSAGEDYNEVFQSCLEQAMTLGAELCVFGDIDIVDHRKWCEDRCLAAGIEPYLPLWQESRESLTLQCIDSGFKPIIKVVDTERMPDVLGKVLDRETAEEIKAFGADMCGENGEYHTFVVDGPVFNYPLQYQLGQKLTIGHHQVIDIL